MIFSEFGSEMEDFWQKEDQNYNLFLHLNAFATYLIGRDKVSRNSHFFEQACSAFCCRFVSSCPWNGALQPLRFVILLFLLFDSSVTGL